MRARYDDITKRLGEPLWYDSYGAPRYDPFHPEMLDAYADYAALVEIECQNCDKRFLVGVWTSRMQRFIDFGKLDLTMPTPDEPTFCWYGDPPRHDNCLGESMLSVPIRIVEFWYYGDRSGWKRLPEYEIEFNLRHALKDDIEKWL